MRVRPKTGGFTLIELMAVVRQVLTRHGYVVLE